MFLAMGLILIINNELSSTLETSSLSVTRPHKVTVIWERVLGPRSQNYALGKFL